MLTPYSPSAIIANELDGSKARRFLLTPIASQLYISFVGRGPLTALRLAEPSSSLRSTFAVRGLLRLTLKGTGQNDTRTNLHRIHDPQHGDRRLHLTCAHLPSRRPVTGRARPGPAGATRRNLPGRLYRPGRGRSMHDVDVYLLDANIQMNLAQCYLLETW